jgi:hypothetical protein
VQRVEHAAAATDREVERRTARPAAPADAAEERTGVDPVSDPTVKGRFVGVDGVVAVPLIDHEEKPEVGHPAGEDDPSVRDRVDGRSPRGGDEDAVPETDARAVRLAEGPDEPSLNRPGESAPEPREGERNARRPGNPREGTVETAEKTCEGVCAGEEEIEESASARDFPSEGGEESATLGTDGREMQKRARFPRAERAEFGGISDFACYGSASRLRVMRVRICLDPPPTRLPQDNQRLGSPTLLRPPIAALTGLVGSARRPAP